MRVWDMMYRDLHWVSTLDNWIISLPDSQRLLWMPPEINQVLCHSHHLTISLAASASLSFKNSKVGPKWATCYASSEPAL